MGVASIREKVVGLKKEGTRFTAESAATVWLAPDGSSEFTPAPELLEDVGVRDIKAKFPSILGRIAGTGAINGLPVDDDNIGELMYSLLGSESSAQDGGTAYTQTLTENAGVEYPVYTMFMDRGASLGVKAYEGCQVNKISLEQAENERLMATVEVIFKRETSGSMGSPTFVNPTPFVFNMLNLKLGGVAQTNVKNLSLSIDNQAHPTLVLNESRYLDNIVADAGLLIEGSFNLYLHSNTEYDKFMSNTTTYLQLKWVGAQIASTGYYSTLDINLYKIEYTAYPYGELDGLFGAAVTFRAVYSTSDSKQIQVEMTNTDSSGY